MVMFFGADPQREVGLSVLLNPKIINIVPVLNEVFRHALCHFETLQTHSSSKQAQEVAQRIDMLAQNMPIFLSKVYKEVEEAIKRHTPMGNNLSASVLLNVNTHFFNLDASVQATCGYSLGFLKITHDDANEQWTDQELQGAIDFTRTNLHILDAYLSTLVSGYRKPSKIARHWMYYCLGAIGIAVSLAWLLDGSVFEAIGCLLSAPAEQHIVAKRKRVRKPFITTGDEPVELNKATESLHSMLLKYRGNKSSENLSDDEMSEIVKSEVKNFFKHPILNFLKVEKFIQGLLIQVERLHVGFEKIKYEANQLFVAHEGKIAIVNHIPAIFISAGVVGVIVITVAYFKLVSCAKARREVKTRLLLSEVQGRIHQFVKCSETAEELRDKSIEYLHGLVLCTLNKYYNKIEKYAKSTREWNSLSRDLVELGKSSHESDDMLIKKRVMDRLYNSYVCVKNMPDE